MSLTFLQSKNNLKICSYNNILLHSAYNPEKEAERFVQSISVDFIPKYITVTGPALSYCLPFLKQRFAYSKFVCIHYLNQFNNDNSLWDKVIYSDDSVQNQLYSYIGEEDASSVLFLSWKPSESAFPKEYQKTWSEIKQFLTTSKNVLATRMYFNKRWTKNAIRFLNYISHINQILCDRNFPILITASGPSLLSMLPVIKKVRTKFYLIAVSSSLYPLLHYHIIPDAVISTDGGYWAKKHLDVLKTFKIPPIPLFLSPESAISSDLLKTSQIIPLCYGDGVETILLDYCNIPCIKAVRNGTVAGTAAELAFSLTDNYVYAVGLDLSTSKGFQHTQPNSLESIAAIKDYRLKPLSTRTAIQSFDSESLSVYKNWFSSRGYEFEKRFLRVYHKDNPLLEHFGNIKEIPHTVFEEQMKDIPDVTKPISIPLDNPITINRRNISSMLLQIKLDLIKAKDNQTPVTDLSKELILWIKTVSLGEYLILEKTKSPVNDKIISDFEDIL